MKIEEYTSREKDKLLQAIHDLLERHRFGVDYERFTLKIVVEGHIIKPPEIYIKDGWE